MEYNFREIEKKWQSVWAAQQPFAAQNNSTLPKYYVLDMFPYPSGAGLHVGHPLGYIASDIVARYKRHQGFNVLHPMGYDSFGLPAEQYAIQTGQHPAVTTEENIQRYREQLDRIGFSFDWSREVRTSNPDYYKWTQWIFIQLFDSWYNNHTQRAEQLDSLVAHLEQHGSQGLSAVCDDNTPEITASIWRGFNEKEKNDYLMHFRLAYLGEAYVNWCAALGTVLANDEVKDGVSERGGHPVERKLMKQWSMRITAYAARLLEGLDGLDWSESLKESQRNWIGRSEGSSLTFSVKNSTHTLEVFTTRPDTIFGVSFLAVAPEHELVNALTTAAQAEAVAAYVQHATNRSERERQAEVEKVSGVFTGSYVTHPFTGADVPVWVAEYVLAGYGTGAVMAVPGHDSRDHRFATHFGLPIIQVIEGVDVTEAANEAKEGRMMASDFLNGLDVKDSIRAAIAAIEAKGLGRGKTNFRLRDAVFGRQRYWGEPIPVYYDAQGIARTVPENELPLVLPEVDKFLPTEDGEPPLARAAANWKYKGQFDYEWTTMPGWAGSSWYFLRYMDAKNATNFADKTITDYWKQVDLYIGGSEHATGHLLYVRFWTKFLFDRGFIGTDEPAQKLINQGMILGRSNFIYRLIGTNVYISSHIVKAYLADPYNQRKGLVELIHKEFPDIPQDIIDNLRINKIHVNIDYVENDNLLVDKFINANPGSDSRFLYTPGGIFGCEWEVEKMSKSKYNVVTPDAICEQYGADTLRLYEMFLGPLEQSKPWNTNGISGVSNFLRRLWRLYVQHDQVVVTDEAPSAAELKTLHKAIKKITEDIDRFSFNTSVSTFMICVNELTELKCNKRAVLEPLLVLISPYAPHITEELWSLLGHTESISRVPFPVFDASKVTEDSVNYPVSFNGKTRLTIALPAGWSKEEIEKEVLSREDVQKYLNGGSPKKMIVVPGKIVNIVV